MSISYFSNKTVIRDGYYFFVPSTWLQRWRYWMQIDPAYDMDEKVRNDVYLTIKQIPRLPFCEHQKFVIPGYMYRFLQLYTSVPFQVLLGNSHNLKDICSDPDKRVELINGKEMMRLLEDFQCEQPLSGFFFEDGENHEIDIFQDMCDHCQNIEVFLISTNQQCLRHLDYVDRVPFQRMVISPIAEVPDISSERQLLLVQEDPYSTSNENSEK